MPKVVTVTLNPALDLTVEVEELVAYRKLRGRLVALDPGGGERSGGGGGCRDASFDDVVGELDARALSDSG